MGFDFGVFNKGKIVEGDFGSVTYAVGFMNRFRDVSGKIDGKSAPSNIKLNYTQNIKYTTPSFKGLSGYLSVENEWIKHTGRGGWENEFYIIPGVNYNTKFNTGIGEVTVSPWMSYSLVSRETSYKKNREDKKQSFERNELRVGVNLSLNLK